MPSQVKLSEHVQDLIICPVTGLMPQMRGDKLVSDNAGTEIAHPIVNGIPILIDESTSVFSVGELINQQGDAENMQEAAKPSFILNAKTSLNEFFMPSISKNIRAQKNFRKFAEILLQRSANPVVLVVGGGSLGEGMDELVSIKEIDLVEGDVYFGARNNIIFDAHSIPFKDGSFDAIIVQAVLEHVADPYQCVDEIHRVLKPEGLVYSEIPFMQQVHMGAHDFTRFTSLGHRRLFRKFTEIERGVMCGPGMALSWAYSSFLRSFTQSWFGWNILYRFGRLTSFFLKYVDHYLVDKPGAEDAASGVYFMGQRSTKVLSDKELIKQYTGTDL